MSNAIIWSIWKKSIFVIRMRQEFIGFKEAEKIAKKLQKEDVFLQEEEEEEEEEEIQKPKEPIQVGLECQ